MKKAFGVFVGLPLGVKLELILYPLFLFWRMPIAWSKSLWKARVLLNGQWHRYMGFHPHNAINSLFYRTQWLNIDRYGRNGVSPVIGLGAHPLKNWFHLALPASYIYANAGAVTTLLGTLVWILSHLIWMDMADPIWVLLVTATLLLSSTAYAMAFARQNYQILGWMWLPIALYAVTNDQLLLASMAWLAGAMAGITAVFFAVPVLGAIALLNESWLPFVTLLPAIILTASRFLPLVRGGGLGGVLLNIAKLIGATSSKVRYHRGMNKLGIVTIYFFVLYLGASMLLWVVAKEPPVLTLLGAALFMINQRFFRVADEQSLIVLNVSLWTFELLMHPMDWVLLIIFWLVASPSGVFLSIQQLSKETQSLPILINAPFDHKEILDRLKSFFIPVNSGESVYFGFSDPNGIYANIFNGYRVIHEAPLYVAAEKGVHLLPDWYAVMETNYQGAPQCWGRSAEEVLDNVKRWGATHAVVYQESGTELEPEWKDHFCTVGTFDWGDFVPHLRGVRLWPKDLPAPKWFLLKPAANIRSMTCSSADR